MEVEKKEGFISYQYLNTEELYQQALRLWEVSANEQYPWELALYHEREKQENEKAMLTLIKKIEASKSKDKLKTTLQEFLEEGPLFSQKDRRIFKDPGFLRSSEEFLQKVRAYDPGLSKEDTGQAFRNVWIMNLLQKTFQIPVVCTEGIFGYSMLYPYTDNYMDDMNISKAEKYWTAARLNRRLLGRKERAVGESEKKIFDMVEKIEETFSRELYPGVYESLLYIHASQVQSLKQQMISKKGHTVKKLDKEMICSISFHKGGASVLADGFLVKGDLTQREAEFCFNYGVLLQLADDLQDCQADYESRHQTFFSEDYRNANLDQKVNQLIRFAKGVFNNFFNNEDPEGMEHLLLGNTTLLILGSVLLNPSCFSKAYLQWAERRYPVSMEFLHTQQEAMQIRVNKLKETKGE